MKPDKVQINAKEADFFDWDERIRNLWNERIAPKFNDKESCSSANYFSPRPYVDEYNRGSNREGFTYVVQPGNHVCQESWEKQ